MINTSNYFDKITLGKSSIDLKGSQVSNYKEFYEQAVSYNSPSKVRERALSKSRQDFFRGINMLFLRSMTSGNPQAMAQGGAMLLGCLLSGKDYWKHLVSTLSRKRLAKLEITMDKHARKYERIEQKLDVYNQIIENKYPNGVPENVSEYFSNIIKKRDACEKKLGCLNIKGFAHEINEKRMNRLEKSVYGRVRWSPRTAAMQQYAFLEQAYSDLRESSNVKDADEVIANYKDAVAMLHMQCQEDGVDMNRLNSSLGVLIQDRSDEYCEKLDLYNESIDKAFDEKDFEKAENLQNARLNFILKEPNPRDFIYELSMDSIKDAPENKQVLHTYYNGRAHSEVFYRNSGEFVNTEGKRLDSISFVPRMPLSQFEFGKVFSNNILNSNLNPLKGGGDIRLRAKDLSNELFYSIDNFDTDSVAQGDAYLGDKLMRYMRLFMTDNNYNNKEDINNPEMICRFIGSITDNSIKWSKDNLGKEEAKVVEDELRKGFSEFVSRFQTKEQYERSPEDGFER